MEHNMPTTNIQWVFLIAISAIILAGSALVLGYEIQNVLAEHEYILGTLPQQVEKVDHNVIRICTHLDIVCET